MSLSAGLSLVALFVAICQLERKGVLQGMLSRPIVLGALLGALLGDLSSGLLLGAVLELLWLGDINVGANLPDNEVVGTGAVVGAALLASGGEPVPLCLSTLALVLLSPMAALTRRVDAYFEKKNVAILGLAERRLASGTSPGHANLIGLIAPPVAGAFLAVTGAALGSIFLPVLIRALPEAASTGLEFSFLLLIAACAAIALSTIKTSRARLYAAVTAAMALLLASAIYWGGPK